MICPTCHGDGETPGDDLPFDAHLGSIPSAPCMNCLGTGEVPDAPSLDELLNF